MDACALSRSLHLTLSLSPVLTSVALFVSFSPLSLTLPFPPPTGRSFSDAASLNVQQEKLDLALEWGIQFWLGSLCWPDSPWGCLQRTLLENGFEILGKGLFWEPWFPSCKDKVHRWVGKD